MAGVEGVDVFVDDTDDVAAAEVRVVVVAAIDGAVDDSD